MEIDTYIGKEKWNFSDEIYQKLTGIKVESNFNPEVQLKIVELPGILKCKRLFGIFWSTPTFKDIDCNYLFRVYDNRNIDYVISSSSANTAEGVARVIQSYNKTLKKRAKAILLVPEISSFKMDEKVINKNPYVKYVVLKNSNLDCARKVALELKERIEKKLSVVLAGEDLKTAAYAQIGLALKERDLLNEKSCIVQTVSGGVGPAGIIESAYKLNVKPKLLVVQPLDGNSAPIVDVLNEHSKGRDPITLFNRKNFETPKVETTLGSTKPIYGINKFVKYRENGGIIYASYISKEEIFENRDRILYLLIKHGLYQNREIGVKLFDLEKSGFIAFIGVIKSENLIESENIIVNFTGRLLKFNDPVPKPAKPHIKFDETQGISKLIDLLKLK